jgi:hypothetical protein
LVEVSEWVQEEFVVVVIVVVVVVVAAAAAAVAVAEVLRTGSSAVDLGHTAGQEDQYMIAVLAVAGNPRADFA